MKIAVFSDTHDNSANITLAISHIKKLGIPCIIHCGDVCNYDTLFEMQKNFTGYIHIACGNNDIHEELQRIRKTNKNVYIYEKIGILKHSFGDIAWCHYPKLAYQLAHEKKYQAIFYGHTHTPWEKKIDDIKIINPGTLGGIFSKPTFAIYDLASKKAELIFIENLL